jgi:biofilm PGA synthesis N-glycosyltransferase PgaC
MPRVAELLLAFVALYPVVTAAVWIAGGVLFRLFDERRDAHVPDGGWPGVTVLIPAYNEEQVIATSVRAALDADYPELEVLVLDDGSADGTAAAARASAAGDPRCEVLRDPVNRGKAEQLNAGFARARHELVVVTDADTHMMPHALRRLAARMDQSPLVAAVAGAPHVTNRTRLICAMQVLEAASIIGLNRRTQSLSGRVGIVAGVLGMFRRERVLAVGGYDARMSTEDIDLTWRLLMAGWHTAYEPYALVGMQVPSTLRALWAQRTRWARGQGEILHEYLRTIAAWRNRRMWTLGLESVASLLWVTGVALGIVFSVLSTDRLPDLFPFGMAWGIAISVVATLQLVVALALGFPYDHFDLRALALAAPYLLLFWCVSACAALHSQIVATIRGPHGSRVVWDTRREQLDATSAAGE